ncbi:sensor histidine kinase [Nocardioides coralli]|uniref:sensor histidine kinase n=1 Tax=Nocardioides coralli TaxID=2872154 RepID=UPI001CA3DE16|nr:sensor histidine kinase [Nocardioides coralli]QZY29499.1 sensor histidine kinase [Nocardioides coralli]
MLRSVPLRTQLLGLQLLIVLTTVVVVGVVAARMQAAQIRESYQQQMIGVAQSVATLPTVVEAFGSDDPSATIQPIAELIREASGVTYVVVTDDRGIRYSHPNPDQLGEMVTTDPTPLESGEMYTGTQTGSLGESWRVKLPIVDEQGEVIGMASVGILESQLRADLLDDLWLLAVFLLGAALLGTLLAALVSRVVWRRIHRVEPEEIAALLETRDAMLHGIGEGIVALDLRGRVALVNDEAQRLLGVDAGVVGSPAAEVLDRTLLQHVESGSTDDGLVLAGERVLLALRRPAVVDGREVGTVVILRDRTELRETLRHLEGVRDQAQALRVQRHEFSNRLHVISGLLELGRTEEAIRFIDRETGSGSARAVELPGVADPEVEALLGRKAQIGAERGIVIEVDPTSTHRFDGTSDVLTVLGNLLDNAMEAVGHDGTVRVLLRTEDDEVRIVVEDDGPGIRADRLDRVFEPGVTTKATGDRPARGIGLALVSRIARRRGGWAAASSPDTGGARFEVRLQAIHEPVVPA